MSKPLISVLMTLYNHEDFVGYAINSVLSQSYQNFELLINDDCSTDKSVEVVKSFNDKRIKLFQSKSNQGTMLSLNKLINKSKGQYIAILDSDDMWYENKLEEQLEFMLNNDHYGATFSHADIVDENGKIYPKDKNADLGINVYVQPDMTRSELLRRFFDFGNCLAHPSLMLKREVFDVVGLHDIRFRQLHDLEFYTRMMLKYDCRIIQKPLIMVRRLSKNNNSVSAQSMENARRSRNETSLLIYNMIDQMDKDLFIDTFKDKIINDIVSKEDLICEKFFLLKLWVMDDINNLLPAMVYISNHIRNDSVLNRLNEKFSYSINDYYKDSGKVLQLYQPYYYPSFKEELDVIYNSASWKITKPFRGLKRLFKRSK